MISEAGDNNDKDSHQEDDRSVPPGAPDRTPIKDPEGKPKPMGDPQPPEKKKPRL